MHLRSPIAAPGCFRHTKGLSQRAILNWTKKTQKEWNASQRKRTHTPFCRQRRTKSFQSRAESLPLWVSKSQLMATLRWQNVITSTLCKSSLQEQTKKMLASARQDILNSIREDSQDSVSYVEDSRNSRRGRKSEIFTCISITPQCICKTKHVIKLVITIPIFQMAKPQTFRTYLKPLLCIPVTFLTWSRSIYLQRTSQLTGL